MLFSLYENLTQTHSYTGYPLVQAPPLYLAVATTAVAVAAAVATAAVG